jgi:hypothetical protein
MNEKRNIKQPMEKKEMMEVIQVKNKLVTRQTRRIELLEQKIMEMRKKYFQLKYADLILIKTDQ